MDNTIIYLLGHEGVGKYTIAKEIVTMTGARLVDNHENETVFIPDYPNVFDLDTTELSARAAASIIINYVNNLELE